VAGVVKSKAFEPPNLLVVTVADVMSSRDQAELVASVRDTIRNIGPVRVLLRLTEFAGWGHEAPLDNSTFWLQDHEAVTKMAIVGEPARRIAVLTAFAQPIRRIPIDYFGAEADARVWLGV
jgi:hypothetical protein